MLMGPDNKISICATNVKKDKDTLIQLTSFWHSFRPKFDCGGCEAAALVGWVEAARLAVGTAVALPPSDAGWSSPRPQEPEAELEAASQAPPPPVSTGEGVDA